MTLFLAAFIIGVKSGFKSRAITRITCIPHSLSKLNLPAKIRVIGRSNTEIRDEIFVNKSSQRHTCKGRNKILELIQKLHRRVKLGRTNILDGFVDLGLLSFSQLGVLYFMLNDRPILVQLILECIRAVEVLRTFFIRVL